jgi:NTP pyrophosphatase (non-canonical NTP hydrolase)
MTKSSRPVHLAKFQKEIAETFLARDRARGLMGTFGWFVEEVGELSTALRNAKPGSRAQEEEFADCLAWLASLANLTGVDLEKALRKYAKGCSRCRQKPCRCRTKK